MGDSPLFTGQKKTGESSSGWRTVSVRVSSAAPWPKPISEPVYNHPNCTPGVPIAPSPAQPTLPQCQVLAQPLALPAGPRRSCWGLSGTRESVATSTQGRGQPPRALQHGCCCIGAAIVFQGRLRAVVIGRALLTAGELR